MTDNNPADFPATFTPTMFADLAMNHAAANGVHKFYLARVDPSFSDGGKNNLSPCVQIVMPEAGFLNLVAFFNTSIAQMLSDGRIKQEDVDATRDAFK
ncbi:hypothetical protein FHS55_001582 [Angulomicrobium tetraedrale]|uniref:Uncharacterized protein n=1 Tax=Ancylobacter tetraedralis TaxID=217068 RepID=A0A839Z9I2_9HYPH|nr:hypothetical protein [Ancylobacter tetraedralis]MBB3770987.1 hypothetical protein [Ancylobacter tetraedralis]